MTLSVSAAFDAGNIEVLDARRAEQVRLRIRPDHQSKHFQWFFFRVSGAKGQPLTLQIENAAEASYPGGWRGYRACASTDLRDWVRVPTRYDGVQLTIDHTPDADAVWFAYFAPYPYTRHLELVAASQRHARARLERLGATIDGRDLDLLVIGETERERRVCWVLARQHPGETMAEWLVEGLLERLLDDADPVARALLEQAVFYVVPNMNPDGGVRGHLRTNAAGVNLNRAWQEPSLDASPEVFRVRERMQRTGASLCLDVHGDEALPYNFIAGADGVPGISASLLALRDRYAAQLVVASPDFQRTHGYPVSPPGRANMTMCTAWTAGALGCLSMTLEQPFKDTADSPDALRGWHPARAKLLGRAQLDALRAVVEDLPRARPMR